MTKDNVKEMPWGMEITWADTDSYIAKFLIFDKKDSSTDMHFLNCNQRNWFVNLGKIKIHTIDTTTGIYKESILEEGATYDVLPNQPVQIKCLSATANITEVSENNKDNKVFILSKGKILA